MKTLVALSLSLSLGLAGCASMDEDTARVAPADDPVVASADQVYVNYVEQVANRRGTRVVWVNPPTGDLHADD